MNKQVKHCAKLINSDPLFGLSPNDRFVPVADTEQFLKTARKRAKGYELFRYKTITVEGEEYKTEPERILTVFYGCRVAKADAPEEVQKLMEAEGLEEVIHVDPHWLDPNSVDGVVQVYDENGN